MYKNSPARVDASPGPVAIRTGRSRFSRLPSLHLARIASAIACEMPALREGFRRVSLPRCGATVTPRDMFDRLSSNGVY